MRLVEALQQHQGVAPFVEVGGLGALQQRGEGLPGLRLFRGVPQGAGIEPAGLPDLQPKGVGLRGVYRTQGVEGLLRLANVHIALRQHQAQVDIAAAQIDEMAQVVDGQPVVGAGAQQPHQVLPRIDQRERCGAQQAQPQQGTTRK